MHERQALLPKLLFVFVIFVEDFTRLCTYFQGVCTHQEDALQLAWHVAFQQLQTGQRSAHGGRLDSPKMKETYGLNSLCLAEGWFTQAFMTNLLIFFKQYMKLYES